MRLRSRINSMYEHATAAHAGAWASFYEDAYAQLTDNELEAFADALDLETLHEILEMHEAEFTTSAAWTQWSEKLWETLPTEERELSRLPKGVPDPPETEPAGLWEKAQEAVREGDETTRLAGGFVLGVLAIARAVKTIQRLNFREYR